MSKIILIGSPNSGKSLLFNRLTGLHQKVANFPGITVDVATGTLSALAQVTLIDFPGTYSQPLIRHSWNRCKHFVTKAGTIIFTVTVSVWLLGYFPNYGEDLGASWLGQIGQFIEPLFAPLGLDWRYGVAIMTSFLAREVFVGTLGAMFGIEGADENMVPLVEQIRSSGLPLGSGVALLVFFAIALMCVSTLAILSKESGSNSLAIKMFVAYGISAYLAAVLAFQLTNLIVG